MKLIALLLGLGMLCIGNPIYPTLDNLYTFQTPLSQMMLGIDQNTNRTLSQVQYQNNTTELQKQSSNASPSQTLTLSLFERIKQGKIIGALTILMGIIGFLISIERFIYLKKLQQHRTPHHPIEKLHVTFQKHRGDSLKTLEYHLDQTVLQTIPMLQKRISLVGLFATTAPLLGLLGTMTGIIKTFHTITLSGNSDPNILAPGISEALVTTVIGLIVAIPLLFLHAALSEKSELIINQLDETMLKLLAQHAKDT